MVRLRATPQQFQQAQNLRERIENPIPHFEDPPTGLIPRGNGWYSTPEVIDPRDPRFFPDSPWNGGNPFSDPRTIANINLDWGIGECGAYISGTAQLFGVGLPTHTLAYVREECRQKYERGGETPPLSDEELDMSSPLKFPYDFPDDTIVACVIGFEAFENQFVRYVEGYDYSPDRSGEETIQLSYSTSLDWLRLRPDTQVRARDNTYRLLPAYAECSLDGSHLLYAHLNDSLSQGQKYGYYDFYLQRGFYEIPVSMASTGSARLCYGEYGKIRDWWEGRPGSMSFSTFTRNQLNGFWSGNSQGFAYNSPMPGYINFPPSIVAVQHVQFSRSLRKFQWKLLDLKVEKPGIGNPYKRNGKLPRPFPKKDCCMTCCNPSSSDQAQNNDLIRQILRNQKKMMEVLGVNEFPARFPAHLNTLYNDTGGQSEPVVNEVKNIPNLLKRQVEIIDGLIGEFGLSFEITDADPNTEGEQKRVVSFNSMSEILSEIYAHSLDNWVLNNEILQGMIKCIIEAGLAKKISSQNYDSLFALIDYFGFKYQEIEKEIPMTFTPGAEKWTDFVKETSQKVRSIDFNPDNADSMSFSDQLTPLTQAASAILQRYMFKLLPGDAKPQLIKRLKDKAEQAKNLSEGKVKVKGQERNLDTEDFDNWLDEVERGMPNIVNNPNFADPNQPWGRDFSDRPRIFRVGKQTSDDNTQGQ